MLCRQTSPISSRHPILWDWLLKWARHGLAPTKRPIRLGFSISPILELDRIEFTHTFTALTQKGNRLSLSPQRAVLVADLGYGDAGKGSVVDFLTRDLQAHTVIRYNGGPQAAHNVVTPDGRHHTFAQFGSGMFVPGVRTYLSRFMLVEPYALFNEEAHLYSRGVTDAFARTLLDRDALVITPYQQAANRLRERARGANRHGSCGLGIGETRADALQHPDDALVAGDMSDSAGVLRKLRRLRDAKRAEMDELWPLLRTLPAAVGDLAVFQDAALPEIIADNYATLATIVSIVDESALREIVNAPGAIVFEGAQGVLLDEDHGFAPYTTWSKTTFDNAATLLAEQAYGGSIMRLGLLRAYFTRHGAGPFVTEDSTLKALLPEAHNSTSEWQQAFRLGHFDLLAARYALDVAGPVDALALTHLDRLDALPEWRVCGSYSYQGPSTMLDAWFEGSAEAITRIKPRHPADLDHQAALARHLFACAPRYQTVAHAGVVPYLEAALGVSVVLTSHGPTSADKRWRDSEVVGRIHAN